MTNVSITIADPTTRIDGSAVSTADIKNLSIYRQSGTDPAVLVGTLSPTASPLVYVDANVEPGSYNYIVSATDQNGLEGMKSDGVPFVVAAVPVQLSAPTIVSIA